MIRRIVHITLGKANPNRMNGVNKVVNSLATFQLEHTQEVEVWGITKSPNDKAGDRPYTLKLFKNVGRFGMDKALVRAIQTSSNDTIFHLHGSFSLELYHVATLLKSNLKRYVYTSHGAFNEVAMQRSSVKKKLYSWLFERRIVKHAYKLHFIGASEVIGANRLFDFGEKFFLLPNGQESNHQERGIEWPFSSSKVLGFVGRLDIHTKGLDLLLKACLRYKMLGYTPFELMIIGGGEGETYIKNFIELNHLQDWVKLLGPLYGEEKFLAMQKMDFLCLNSRNEGLPGVVLESLSQATPVIISKQTNLGEAVDIAQAGFVLDQNEVDCLVSVLKEAIEMEESNYRFMQKNAKQLIAEQFDWSTIAFNMLKEYA